MERERTGRHTPMNQPPADIILCPMCDVPHRRAAATCDSCAQPLHSRPDFDAIEDEYRSRKKQLALAGAAILVMLALNWIALIPGGGGVLLVAPLGWFGWSLVRLRVLRKRLARR
jgi:hypothetical protein